MEREKQLQVISKRLAELAFRNEDWLLSIIVDVTRPSMNFPLKTEFMFGEAVRNELEYLCDENFSKLSRPAFSLVAQVGKVTIYWIEDQNGEIVYHERSPGGKIIGSHVVL